MALWLLGLAAFGLLVAWGLRKGPGLFRRPRRDSIPGQGPPEAAGSGGEARGFAVGSCRLFCKPSALAQALLGRFCRSPCLEARSWTWKAWPSLQTAVQFLWPPGPPLELARDHLQLGDKGLVALDWVLGPRPGPAAPARAAVLLVVPNASGGVTRHLHQLCRRALSEGYRPVVFNCRGHNGCPLATPKLQPFGEPADLREAVAYVRFRHPAAALFAISEGSGSGLLLSYLGESGSSSCLAGAACLSPILEAPGWFERELPWWCRWPWLLSQKRELSRYASALRAVAEVDRALGSRSLWAFEEALFCRKQEVRNETLREAYWERHDPLRDVDEVAVPVLCLCSADDPVRGPPGDTIPWELFRSNPYFFLLLSPHGGHCGFFGDGPGHSWGHSAALEFLGGVAEFLRAEEEGLCRRGSCLHPRRTQGAPLQPETSPLREAFSWQRSYTR